MEIQQMTRNIINNIHGVTEIPPFKENLFWLLNLSLLSVGLMSRVFANGPGDRVSVPGWVMPKTPKLLLDATLLNTQHYKVRIKGKVEQSKEWSSALLYTLVW